MKIRNMAPLALLALAACAPEVEGRLYLQDILEAVEGKEAVIVPVSLRIPESSEDECKTGLAALGESLAAITPVRGVGSCVESGGNQFSQFDLDMPLLGEGVADDGVHLFTLHVLPTTFNSDQAIILALELRDPIAEVQEAIGRGESGGFSVGGNDDEEPKFIFHFENDTRDPVGLMPNHVFVDGKPGLPMHEHSVSLDRRGSVTIKFSDVVSAYVKNANAYEFATIYPEAAR